MRRKTRRGNSASRPPLYGIGAMDANVYLATTDPAGTPGNAAGFWVAVIFRMASLDVTNYIMSSTDSASDGWALWNTTGPLLKFACASGAGALVQSPGYTLTAGKDYAAVGVHDGTKVRLYVQGAQSADGTAITGYTVRSAPAYVAAGGAANGFLTFYGAAYGLGAPSAANVLDWYSTCRAQRRVVDMPGTPASRLWRTVPAAGDMTDLVGGSVPLAKGGVGHTAVALTSPNWG